MVFYKPLNILVVLVLLSFAKGLTLLGDWTLTKLSADTLPTGIANAQNGGIPAINADTAISIDPNVGCSSISLNSEVWSLTADASSSLITLTEYAFGFWVNFESTISNKVFQFGSDSGAHYIVSSTVDGTLKVSFFSDATTTDSANDFSITVPLNKWFFIVFHFFDNSGTITLEIIFPGTALISKTSGSSAVAFALPGGLFYFGMSIKGKFHKVVLTKSATINASFDTITLNDGSSTEAIAAPCTPAADCIDSVCSQSFSSLTGSICLSSLQYCTTCTASGCITCDPDSARDEAQYCRACKDDGTTNELKNYHCCAKANHCAACSTKSTQCDLCPAGYFLNDDSVTSSTSCISCTDSCTNCQPGPDCYTCATTITQTGTTCREDSVGFQVSVNLPNIVIDFAHPLSTGLSKSSFTATSNSGTNIATSTWTFAGCTAGLMQCSIGAPNLQESDLPVTLDFEFTQV
ncbi:unnamed protein product [Blepharisma stoltei]|uniref:TNFR-Cys domain-containing protein n=1 Tax=Blepharisma stoltei TaxID=1481888 RepID=A0AAU9KE34_9CILI|nr:unnamed protein product [Blepharisma stoltei]